MIKDLDEAIAHCDSVATECDNIQCANDHRQLKDWLVEFKSLKSKNKWISVDDALPETDNFVLGLDFTRTVRLCRYSDISQTKKGWTDGKWNPVDNPTVYDIRYWTFIPERPKFKQL